MNTLRTITKRHAGSRVVQRCIAAICACFLAVASSLLHAADPVPPIWQGVWQGTVGALPVRACLAWDRVGPGDAFGSYYYLAKLRTIHLQQQGTSKLWVEGYPTPSGTPAPRWKFEEVTHDRLTGTWTRGGRALPFKLTRVASDDEEAPCGTDAFNGPRWRSLTVKASPAVQDGVPYRSLVFGVGPAFPSVALAGFELIGSDAATKRLNVGLRKLVPGAQEDWRGCITGGLDAHGVDGDLEANLSPNLITKHWLGAELAQDDECGGAHPNSGVVPVTFDRTTGAAVDLHSWLNDAAVNRSEANAELPPTLRLAFRRVLIAEAGDIEPDCRDAVADEEFWDVGLDRKGLTFRPELPHATQACADDVLVRWASLTRYLTAEGRAGRANLSTP